MRGARKEDAMGWMGPNFYVAAVDDVGVVIVNIVASSVLVSGVDLFVPAAVAAVGAVDSSSTSRVAADRGIIGEQIPKLIVV